MMDAPRRRIFTLAVPMAGEQFLVFGILLFDTALVGRLGAEALSAQAVVFHWVQFTSVLFSIMAIGGSILIAQAVGQRDHGGAEVILQSALTLALLAGLLAALVVELVTPLLVGIMGVESGVYALTVPYLRLMALSFPLNFLLLTAAGCIRGAGDARTPLLVMIAANGVHILLAVALVFSLRLGLEGLALATITSRGLGMVFILLLLVRGVAGLKLRQRRPNLHTMRRVWNVGSAVGGEQLALRLGQLVNLRLVSILGTQALAAYSVVTNGLSIILIIGMGFMTATLTVVGQQVGAQQESSIRSTSWQAVYLAWIIMGGLGLLFFLGSSQVAGLFSSDAGVVMLAAAGLRLVLIGIPFEVVNQVLTGSIRGAGDTRFPMWITTLGHWLVRLPLILLFIGPLNLGLDGIWIAMVVEMAVRAVLNARRVRGEFWRHRARPRALEA
jgi:putative MATE family efflux protein